MKGDILLLIAVIIIFLIIISGCSSSCRKKYPESYRKYSNNYYDSGEWMKEVYPFIGPFATREEVRMPTGLYKGPSLLSEDLCEECNETCKLRRWNQGYSANDPQTKNYCEEQCKIVCDNF